MKHRTEPRLPDFLVIGAMKCGTTSLHRYLGSHPQVFTTATKEVDYFARSARAPETLAEYAAHFQDAESTQIAGESSTNYMKEHAFPGTAGRIADLLPHVKLVCVLRDPIERVVSHYQHNVWRGRETRPFAHAVEEEPGYLATSRYAWQLTPYLERFDRSQIQVLSAEDLDAQPRATVRRVLGFLQVDEEADLTIDRRHNVTARHNRKHGLEFPDGNGLRVTQRERKGRTYQSVALTDEMRHRLATELSDDVRKLRSLTGEDFHHWDVG